MQLLTLRNVVPVAVHEEDPVQMSCPLSKNASGWSNSPSTSSTPGREASSSWFVSRVIAWIFHCCVRELALARCWKHDA